MVPTDKVSVCPDRDSIGAALDAITEMHISAIVVLNELGVPVGICTKTDFVRAYQKGIGLDEKVGYLMSTNLHYVVDTASRDDAAASFEEHKNHHALVKDKNEKWVGLISSWDIAVECMKDGKAWPYTRSTDGRVHGLMAAH